MKTKSMRHSLNRIMPCDRCLFSDRWREFFNFSYDTGCIKKTEQTRNYSQLRIANRGTKYLINIDHLFTWE